MTRDQVEVVLIAAGWTAAVGVLGLAASRGIARWSFRWLLALVAAVAVGGVVAGVIGTADAMFLSAHDRGVALLVCLVAGIVAVVFALAVGASVVRGSNAVRDQARQFAETGLFAATTSGPAELRALSAELARTSETLQRSRARERQLEVSRRELIAWVSHDLRTPLAGLRAMTEALEDGLAEDPERYHRQMRAEVDRMVRMVNDLFELSRIHAGLLTIDAQPVDLSDMVSEAIAGAHPIADAVGVKVSGEVTAGATLLADPAGISRVVANLLVNAIRHTPADGTVTIAGRQVGDDIEISVRDACGGIPESDLDRVFDIAWRGSTARTPERTGAQAAGAGLGLAIVKGIVEAHHGAVDVVNETIGCCFSVRIPADVAGAGH